VGYCLTLSGRPEHEAEKTAYGFDLLNLSIEKIITSKDCAENHWRSPSPRAKGSRYEIKVCLKKTPISADIRE
tara:strand:+ start:1588 stop:1806 length:219 start_codon:yes stop_codon:yes gene_type:complete